MASPTDNEIGGINLSKTLKRLQCRLHILAMQHHKAKYILCSSNISANNAQPNIVSWALLQTHLLRLITLPCWALHQIRLYPLSLLD